MRKVKIFRTIMVFWTLFIGIGAVAGATGMLVAPDGSAMGMQSMLPYFQVLPFAGVLFQDFIVPGIALLLINGIPNLIAAYFLLRNKKIGGYLGCSLGVILMLWITIQFVIFPLNFLSAIYFFFGLLQFLCGVAYIIFEKQSKFHFDASLYHSIGTDSSILVVYFSRKGYTKKIAYEKANKLGADLFEITTPERTKGFFGFAWLGRFAMHKWAMPIHPVTVDVSKYEKVIIVTPIHVWTVASPVKEFCRECKGKIKHVEYTVVHFRKNRNFFSACDAMDKELQTKAEAYESIVCKFGRCQLIDRR